MKKIPLTQGYFALVDDADYELLNVHKWRVNINSDGAKYAVRQYREPGVGKRVLVFMHRVILGLEYWFDKCDHIDHNGLNNQRCNLRKCTQSQNLANRRPIKGRVLKGVYRNRRKKKTTWNAKCIGDNLGTFSTELEAAKAYNEHLLKHRGEFALLNPV